MVRFIKTSLLAAALLLSASAQAAFEGCPQFFARGVAPKVSQYAPGNQRELCFSGFAILHSGQSKTPVYVAEKLNRAHMLDARDEERTDNFYEEARLPSDHRARLPDYREGYVYTDATGKKVKVSYDRGHMAPAADSASQETMAQSFSLANMVPQAPQNNRKLWKGIEQATRKYVLRASGDVFVITGPIYSGQVNAVGRGQVWIPSHLYKLVYDQSAGKAWAYWVENTDAHQVPRPISYAELVKRTGTEFLPGVRLQD